MAKKTHGMSRSKPYRAYIRLLHRCYNKHDKDFHNYGGRNPPITVCERWLGEGGFLRFLEDMRQPPGPEYSIDRLDNSGPYSPENCAWRTRSEQGRNRRTCRMLEFLGQRKCLSDFADDYGLSVKVLWRRLERNWSMGRALGTEIVRRKAA